MLQDKILELQDVSKSPQALPVADPSTSSPSDILYSMDTSEKSPNLLNITTPIAVEIQSVPGPSTTSQSAFAKSMDESPHTPEQTSPIPIANETPTKRKLRQQLKVVTERNILQSQKIRQLQKKVWLQKKRIFKLTLVIKEFERKNLINANHVSNLIDEFRENKDIINRLFNRTRGHSVEKQYSAENRKFSLTLHFFFAQSLQLCEKPIS